MDELSLAVALPFKKTSTNSMSIKDFEFALSFDLKWMSPEQASKVRDRAIMASLLGIEDGNLVFKKDLDSIEVPAGFKPSDELFMQKGLLDLIIDRLMGVSLKNKKEVVSLINSKQERLEGLVYIEVASLLVARDMEANVDEFYDLVYEQIMSTDS